MLRTAVLVGLALAGCTREPDPPASPATPENHAAVRPPARAAAIHGVDLTFGGLATWHGQICGGCTWHVVADLDAATVVATDPDHKPWTRKLDPGELRALTGLAAAARIEPETKQSQAFDSVETLRITDDAGTFEVSNTGQIQRPAAKELVTAMNTAARWKPD
jgi:hypothetical protein